MPRIKSIYPARLVSLAIALVILLSYPMGAVALADGSTPDPGSTPTTGTIGPSTPTGADANTFIYNPSTGLWENTYYTWDPVTHLTSPKTPQTYSYNPTTGMWDTTRWIWDAPSGKYVPNIISSAQDPNPSPAPASNDPSINTTGPNSTNNINQTTNNNGTFNNFFNATISNNLKSQATSGDASVTGNTSGGSSQSGNASGITNILNLLQSNWSPQNLPMLFNANINGNVTGDLVLDPNIINHTGPGSTSGIDTTTNNNLTINSGANGAINNTIALDATSGNSSVSGNTTGGDATTGNARVVANLINVLNSAITDGKSFIGNININGNLNGDILLPPGFLEQLIANSGPGSTVNTSQTVNNNVVANIDNTQTINNLTKLGAASGNANVSGNTTAGAAKTGTADTNLTVLNLTGQQVIGANTLLVFINVLGKWVGMLMNAPGGSNSAAYCGGNCQISSLVNNNVTVNQSSNNAINNNLNLNALSGNANVSGNTKAGNATSGNASASANILNISGSQLSSLDWLGILFINVNGFWNGSFGFNTAAGNTTSPAASSPAVAGLAKVFKVEPAAGGNGGFKIVPIGGNTGGSPTNRQVQPAVAKIAQPAARAATHTKKGGLPTWLPVAVGIGVLLLVLVGGFASEMSDRIWAMCISRSQNHGGRKLPSLNLPHVNFGQIVAGKSGQVRDWLTSFSWKFPIL